VTVSAGAPPSPAKGPPRPPRNLARRVPLRRTLSAGSELHRFYRRTHEPLFFDRGPGGRFNAPDGSFGVMYLALEPAGAFAETFLRNPGESLISLGQLTARGYACYRLVGDVVLIELSGPGLARVGATAEVCHGGLPYDVPQQWSGALHAAFPDTAGIGYMARHDDQTLCVALYDRHQTALAEMAREVDLDQDWVMALADRYGIGITA
jgi:hypothetical protein